MAGLAVAGLSLGSESFFSFGRAVVGLVLTSSFLASFESSLLAVEAAVEGVFRPLG